VPILVSLDASGSLEEDNEEPTPAPQAMTVVAYAEHQAKALSIKSAAYKDINDTIQDALAGCGGDFITLPVYTLEALTTHVSDVRSHAQVSSAKITRAITRLVGVGV